MRNACWKFHDFLNLIFSFKYSSSLGKPGTVIPERFCMFVRNYEKHFEYREILNMSLGVLRGAESSRPQGLRYLYKYLIQWRGWPLRRVFAIFLSLLFFNPFFDIFLPSVWGVEYALFMLCTFPLETKEDATKTSSRSKIQNIHL